MIKEKMLKKKLMIESGMLAAFLVFLGVIAFIGSSILESMQDDRNKLQSQNANLVTQNTQIQERIKKASTSIELYQVLVKTNKQREFNINRETGRNIFTALRQKYHLNLTGNNAFGQIYELTDEQFKKKTAQVVASDADLSFESASDELVFQFLFELYRRLPGFMVIDSMQLSKKAEITNQTLVDIGAGKFPSLVDARIHFKWIGLKPNAPAKPADPNAPATPPQPKAAP